MPLKMFGYNPKRIACDKIGTVSDYQHSFGGSAKDFGIEVVDAPLLLHLIYRLDLADPLLSIDLPGASFLPLFFSLFVRLRMWLHRSFEWSSRISSVLR